MRLTFKKGLKDGIPIALGYVTVSFGFGITAVRAGLSILAAVGMSATNLTSAGQAAGVAVIAAAGTLAELALTQLIINIRYSLMALSLSQKLDSTFTLPHRLIASFGITDEIFAVASSQSFPVTPAYMYGLVLDGLLSWTLGTFLGAYAGSVLPQAFTDAMGIALYGMFLAIIIPPARKMRSVLFVVVLSAAMSIVFRFALPFISEGFSVIICAVIASAAGALLFPVNEEATS